HRRRRIFAALLVWRRPAETAAPLWATTTSPWALARCRSRSGAPTHRHESPRPADGAPELASPWDLLLPSAIEAFADRGHGVEVVPSLAEQHRRHGLQRHSFAPTEMALAHLHEAQSGQGTAPVLFREAVAGELDDGAQLKTVEALLISEEPAPVLRIAAR